LDDVFPTALLTESIAGLTHPANWAVDYDDKVLLRVGLTTFHYKIDRKVVTVVLYRECVVMAD
jgi:hypothetical protein